MYFIYLFFEIIIVVYNYLFEIIFYLFFLAIAKKKYCYIMSLYSVFVLFLG